MMYKHFIIVISACLCWGNIFPAPCPRVLAADVPPAKLSADKQSSAEAASETRTIQANDSTSQEQVAKLIEELGDKDYYVRQRAQNELARWGFEAFDALAAATTHDDLEIASRAKYLLRLMRVEWTAKNDPPEVKKLLRDYELLPEEARRARMHALAVMPEGKGISALCRLIRFEKSDVLSKIAAIELLRSSANNEPPKGARAETIRQTFAKSKRPSAAWMLVWLKLAEDPQAAMAQWDKLIDQESALLQRLPGETSPEILSGLIRYQIAWQKKHGQTERALTAMRRLVDLEKGDLDTLVELLDWLAEEKAWKLIDELAARFTPRFNSEPILLYALAEAQKEQGETAKAEELAQRAFRLNAGNEDFKLVQRYLLAGRLRREGLFAWAKREYQYVIDQGKPVEPVTIRTQIELADMLHDRGENQAAAALLEATFKATGANFPFNPDIIGRTVPELRAMMYYFQACHWQTIGEESKHSECLDKALALDPANIDVLIACYRLPKQTPEYRQKIGELIRKATDDMRRISPPSPTTPPFTTS